MAANGFSNVTVVSNSGPSGAASSGAATATQAGDQAASASVSAPAASDTAVQTASAPDSAACGTTMVTVTKAAASTSAAAASVSSAASGVASSNSTGASTGSSNSGSGAVEQSSIAGLDFGLCVPTMKFEAGLDGRSATESTFQAIEPLVNKGQQEALNPNIITNRICDQLTNVCNANDAAKTACDDAKTKIAALGTKDKTSADAWNTALGFDGADTQPDGNPVPPGTVGHA